MSCARFQRQSLSSEQDSISVAYRQGIERHPLHVHYSLLGPNSAHKLSASNVNPEYAGLVACKVLIFAGQSTLISISVLPPPTSACSSCRTRHRKCVRRKGGPCEECRKQSTGPLCDHALSTESADAGFTRPHALLPSISEGLKAQTL